MTMGTPPLHRRGFNLLAIHVMMSCCVHGIDMRSRTLFSGAVAASSASAASMSATAFQLQHQSPHPGQRLSQNLYSSPHRCSFTRKPRIRSLASFSTRPSSSTLQQSSTSTGWINPDTLNFHKTIHNNNNQSENGNNNEPKIDHDDGDTKIKYPAPSSVERLLIRDRLVYIKRDDVLHLPGSNVSGNKARKFLALNDIPAADFPDAIVSYGGPQSNAMVALAAIVSSKNAELEGKVHDPDDWLPKEGGDNMFWQLDVSEDEANGGKEEINGEQSSSMKSQSSSNSSRNTQEQSSPAKKKRFIYYTKTMPRYLRKYPNGNLLRALALGMEVRTVSHDQYDSLFGGLHGGSVLAPADLDPPIPGGSLWMPQGGACGVAEPGSDVLADEIVEYWERHGKGMPLAVCVPGGTCTTALLLHRSINTILDRRTTKNKQEEMDIQVIVIPCVGDDEYAMRQMRSLDRSVGGRGLPEDVPFILRPRSDVEYGSARRRSKGYFRFGEPAKAILQTFDELNEAGLFLDLMYGAPAFSLLLQHWRSRDGDDCPIAGRQVMYVHTGGLEGIASQLTRYKHKGLIDARTIQIA